MRRPVHILSGARTPFSTWARGRDGTGTRGGKLAKIGAMELGTAALTETLSRAKVPASKVTHVVFGNMYYSEPASCYGSRTVALRSGVPASAATPTVSMACGSGLYSIVTGAREIAEGHSLVGVGGMDNVSMLPKELFVDSFHDPGAGCHIGETVAKLSAERGIERETMDAWALRSHELASDARRSGRLAEEIVSVGDVSEDDAILAAPEPSHFSNSRLGFGDAITRANTHALVDGASSLLLADETGAAEAAPPLGKLLSYAAVGVEPSDMGLASVPAIRAALMKAELPIDSVDLFEINETFAAQTLLDIRELGLPDDKVNVNGGAIALGHPFAASGCKLVLGLLLELRRRNLRYGVASLCVGGGQGIAVVVER